MVIFFFHIASVVRFVRSIVGPPNGIVLALVIVTPLRANIAAGLVRLVHERVIAVSIIPRPADQKELAAVLTEVWNVVLLQSVEEIIIQK